MKRGLLLINLGTPESPHAIDVKRYLNEFLMDPLVIDIPWLARLVLVKGIITPRRSTASGKLYEKIWTERGSPLLYHTQDLASLLRKTLGESVQVEIAMRYGVPNVTAAAHALKRWKVSEVAVLPLYPQYSLAATKSSQDKVLSVFKAIDYAPKMHFIDPFFDKAPYLDAVAEVSRPQLDAFRWDRVLFSFHGLPERQVKRTDPSGNGCLVKTDCCERASDFNGQCYRYQCYETARQLAQRLKLSPAQYQVAFQSRLGRTPWIRPYSDHLYESLPKEGVKRLAVLCPSFVADCLETLEEVAIRGAEQFRNAGGEELRLISSLNSESAWANAIPRLLPF